MEGEKAGREGGREKSIHARVGHHSPQGPRSPKRGTTPGLLTATSIYHSGPGTPVAMEIGEHGSEPHSPCSMEDAGKVGIFAMPSPCYLTAPCSLPGLPWAVGGLASAQRSHIGLHAGCVCDENWVGLL